MDEKRDPLLDALLDEVLGGQTPPDLTARILQRWETQQAGPPPPVQAKPAATVALPSPPSSQTARGRKSKWRQLSLAAAVVLLVGFAIGGMALIGGFGDPRDAHVKGEPDGPSKAVIAKSNPSSEPVAVGGESPKRVEHQGPERREENVFDKAPPFGRPPSERAIADVDRKRPSARPLPDEEVVAAIDRLIREAWQSHEAKPSPAATDEEFCRRLYLAMVGRIPSVDELGAFIDDRSPDKRAELTSRLQTDPVYADQYVANWTSFWTNALIGRSGGTRPGELVNRDGLRAYLRESLSKNVAYDKLVYELLTATGANRPGADDFNGATNFLLAGMSKDGELATARTARIFHGRQLQCVQCHNHPTNESWTQNQFWELNAFLRQTHAAPSEDGVVSLADRDFFGEDGQDIDEAEIYYERLDGLKRVAYPVFLDGRQISKNGAVGVVNRRVELAKFVIDSPALGRAVVNRVWSRFYQYGFTRTVDDMGPHAEVSHPELLDHLAKQFEAHEYDLNRLVRWIAASEPFRLSSRVSQDALADAPEAGSPPLFSRYYTRQLSPEAVYDSLLLAANMRADDQGGHHQLAQRAWVGQFSKSMGTDEGDEANSFIGDIGQSVAIMTSPIMAEATSGKRGVLQWVATSQMSDQEKIEHLFLAALSRKPTARELKAVTRVLDANRGDVFVGLQDIWWALLNSNEFLLDH